MYTILKPVIHEINIKKSNFITLLFPLEENNIEEILKQVKRDYPKANHYCYAATFFGTSSCSDDKEPSGTAGMPLLNVLQKKHLTNVLLIVVRYFGGIKLGAGGLVRAYSKCATEALKDATTIVLEKGVELELEVSYEMFAQLEKLGFQFSEKTFAETISCTGTFTLDEKEQLRQMHPIHQMIKKEVWIKKIT